MIGKPTTLNGIYEPRTHEHCKDPGDIELNHEPNHMSKLNSEGKLHTKTKSTMIKTNTRTDHINAKNYYNRTLQN